MTDQEQLHRTVLNHYLAVRHLAEKTATEHSAQIARNADWRWPVSRDQLMRRVADAIHRAHVFEFPGELYATLFIETDRYTTEVVGGQGVGTYALRGPFSHSSFGPVGQERWRELEHRKLMEQAPALGIALDLMDSESRIGVTLPRDFSGKDFFDAIEAAGRKIRLPEEMPFDAMYLGWGNGIGLAGVNVKLYGLDENEGPYRVVSHLVTRDPVVEIIFPVYAKKGDPVFFVPHMIEEDGDWEQPYSLQPWIISAVISAINDQESLIHARPKSLWDRMHAKKKGFTMIGGSGLPPYYYSVPIRPQVVHEQLRKPAPTVHVERGHRWDVRGNWKTRLMREALPLDDRTRAALLKRKYKIFTALDPIDAETAAWLMRRHESPPKVGEWLAVLRYFQREHIRGPKDKPHIPSTRYLASEARVRPAQLVKGA